MKRWLGKIWIAAASLAALSACDGEPAVAKDSAASDAAGARGAGVGDIADAAAPGDSAGASAGDASVDSSTGADAGGDGAGGDGSSASDGVSGSTVDAGVEAGAGGCVEAAPCDDGDACTVGDVCKAGSCIAGVALQCNGNACAAASCDPAKGCQFQDVAGTCDDASACTSGDTCQQGLCVGKSLICDDGNVCTAEACDPAKGCTKALEPNDSLCGDKSVCVQGACVPTGTIFAHTSSALYRLELKNKAFVLVGNFTFNKYQGEVTDIAIDRKDTLYAITYTDLFTCKTSNAACTWLMTLPQSFNGMTFVHSGTIYPDQDALIGIANSGGWYHVQYAASPPAVVQLGSYGSGYGSSGDAFSVKGIGTFATATKLGSPSDVLVKVDPMTGKVLSEVGATGVYGLWGVAWWQGVAYGFSSGGTIYEIDLKTGKAKSLSGFQMPSASWWGAGVSTEASN